MFGRKSRVSVPGVLVTAAAMLLALPVSASAAVEATIGTTHISNGDFEGTALFATSDGAADTIALSCGPDGNVLVNGAAPANGPARCGDLESIQLRGNGGGDRFDLRAVSGRKGFNGNEVVGGTGAGGGILVIGGGGGDTLLGGPRPETFSGGPGRDTALAGAAGVGFTDILRGGPGGDDLRGQRGSDRILGGAGNDKLSSGPGSGGTAEDLRGGPGDDVLHGGPDEDILHGDAGDDALFGGAYFDILFGGPGKDRLDGGPGRDIEYQA